MNSPETVGPDSLVTLHYRVDNDGVELVSTFNSSPATLQLGTGELAPPLEQCLFGVGVGEQRVFLLTPDEAFGPRNVDLVQRLPLSELPSGQVPELHGTIGFRSAAGAQFTGIVRELDADGLLIDFNHPLAGKTIRFEVEIKGIL